MHWHRHWVAILAQLISCFYFRSLLVSRNPEAAKLRRERDSEKEGDETFAVWTPLGYSYSYRLQKSPLERYRHTVRGGSETRCRGAGGQPDRQTDRRSDRSRRSRWPVSVASAPRNIADVDVTVTGGDHSHRRRRSRSNKSATLPHRSCEHNRKERRKQKLEKIIFKQNVLDPNVVKPVHSQMPIDSTHWQQFSPRQTSFSQPRHVAKLAGRRVEANNRVKLLEWDLIFCGKGREKTYLSGVSSSMFALHM